MKTESCYENVLSVPGPLWQNQDNQIQYISNLSVVIANLDTTIDYQASPTPSPLRLRSLPELLVGLVVPEVGVLPLGEALLERRV